MHRTHRHRSLEKVDRIFDLRNLVDHDTIVVDEVEDQVVGGVLHAHQLDLIRSDVKRVDMKKIPKHFALFQLEDVKKWDAI